MEIINQQFKDMKIKRIKEHQDQIVEGEIIKLQAQDALEKEKQKEEERREKHKQMNENFKKSNQDLEVLKKLQKEKDIAEEKKIEEFSLKKDQMFNLRRKKEEEKAKEKQRQRQILIDKQVEYLKKKSKEQ